jgi:hypothetical protein
MLHMHLHHDQTIERDKVALNVAYAVATVYCHFTGDLAAALLLANCFLRLFACSVMWRPRMYTRSVKYLVTIFASKSACFKQPAK